MTPLTSRELSKVTKESQFQTVLNDLGDDPGHVGVSELEETEEIPDLPDTLGYLVHPDQGAHQVTTLVVAVFVSLDSEDPLFLLYLASPSKKRFFLFLN